LRFLAFHCGHQKPFFALQYVRIIHFRKEIDRINRMNRIPKEQNDNGLVRALSCKSCSSCQKHLFWLRLAVLGFLRIFAAIQSKRLSMNYLHSKLGRFQSRSIKLNQGKSR